MLPVLSPDRIVLAILLVTLAGGCDRGTLTSAMPDSSTSASLDAPAPSDGSPSDLVAPSTDALAEDAVATAPADAAPTETAGSTNGLVMYCSARMNAGGCDDALCALGCCGGPNQGGCAACCLPRPCTAISANKCPTDSCQIMIDCAGNQACTNLFNGSRPSCGALSYYGQDVACCPGLVKRCGRANVNGMCDSASGGYNGFPQCIACGDGACDPVHETACNCPEDCRL